MAERLHRLTLRVKQTGQDVVIKSADAETTTEQLLTALAEEIKLPEVKTATLIQESKSNPLKPDQTLKAAGIRDGETLIVARSPNVSMTSIILAYIGAMALLAIVGALLATLKVANVDPIEATVGVPRIILLFAIGGSLFAILSRLYDQRFEQTTNEIIWLITRPIMGILMGVVASIAARCIIEVSGGNIVPQTAYVLWVIAFLSGSSDRFFEAVTNIFRNLISREQGGPSAGQS